MKFTAEELLEIEKQLSFPEGESGLKIAENMNESNIHMTISAIDSLDIANGNVLLEIGHGNCGHLNKIFDITKNIKYTGLEISDTLKNEAERMNHELVKDEIYIILRVYGVFVLAFAQKEFMKKLPFVKNKFRLYNHEDVNNLVNQTNFRITEFIDKKDIVKSKSGDVVEREYTVVKMLKS